MSIKTYPFSALAAHLSVTPAPHSVAESTAVLRKLASFGQVSSFKKHTVSNGDIGNKGTVLPLARPSSQQQQYKVLFSSEADLSTALEASPFVVDVNHNLPNPKTVDPYNIRGLQSRRQPAQRSFTCQLIKDEKAFYHLDLAKQTPSYQSFQMTKDSPLYKGLQEARAPWSIIHGISSITVDNSVKEDANTSEVETSQQDSATPSVEQPVDDEQGSSTAKKPARQTKRGPTQVQPSPNLMEMYRKGLQNRPLTQRIPKRLIPPPPQAPRGLEENVTPLEGRYGLWSTDERRRR